MSELKRFDIGYLGSEFESVRSYVDHGEYVDAGEAEDRIAEQEAQIAALESRVEFLECGLKGHLVFKSQTPSANPTADHTIALGLGESIMKHHPVQHTKQGTALFVEVRVLDAVRPEEWRMSEIKRYDYDPCSIMYEHEDGDWVKYDDYVIRMNLAAQAVKAKDQRIAELEAELQNGYAKCCGNCSVICSENTDLHFKLAGLELRVADLVSIIREYRELDPGSDLRPIHICMDAALSDTAKPEVKRINNGWYDAHGENRPPENEEFLSCNTRQGNLKAVTWWNKTHNRWEATGGQTYYQFTHWQHLTPNPVTTGDQE